MGWNRTAACLALVWAALASSVVSASPAGASLAAPVATPPQSARPAASALARFTDPARRTRVVSPAPDVSLRRRGEVLEPSVSALPRSLTAALARTTLPARLASGFRVADEKSGVAMHVRYADATDARGEIEEGGLVLYADGVGEGRHVAHRPHAEGVEDFVLFPARPADEELRYLVELDGRAGLRLVGMGTPRASNVLELVAEDGAPRLRMSAPAVFDATGAALPATVTVEGCAVDTSPRAPWGRPVTRPGASTCVVRVGWRASVYPVLVDPSWTTTGSLSISRAGHTANLVGAGLVLIAGGEVVGPAVHPAHDGGSEPAPTLIAELYDPATGVFATTGQMMLPRLGFASASLPDGRVLFVGGDVATTAQEVYDPASGGFSSRARLKLPRDWPTATVLPNGKVLVAGASTSTFSTELYDPVTDTSTIGAATLSVRFSHTASLLPSGAVLFAGGWGRVEGANTALYLPDQDAFEPIPELDNGSYQYASATVLPSGSVLVAGGFQYAAGRTVGVAEVFDPTTRTFRASGAMIAARNAFTATAVLPSGLVLLVGGLGGASTAELFNPATGGFAQAGSLVTPRSQPTATLLPTGQVLVVGSGRTAEVFEDAPRDAHSGGACSVGAPRARRGGDALLLLVLGLWAASRWRTSRVA